MDASCTRLITEKRMMTGANKSSKAELLWMRAGYGGFIALAVYFLFFTPDSLSALSNFALALCFDPFDTRVKWIDRPRWQRGWLLVHLLLLLALLVYSLTRN